MTTGGTPATPRLTWCSAPAAAMTAVIAETPKVTGSAVTGSGSPTDRSATKWKAKMPRPTTSEPPTSHAVRPAPCEARTRQAASSTAYDSMNATSSRSEEHTSELQSRQYLVCRLLLEKK